MTKAIDVSLLAPIPLFQALPAESLQHIAHFTHERAITRGEVLFQKGDIPNGFFIVVSGQIKLAMSSAQGNEKVVEIISSRQSFGEALMFMDDRPYPVYAEALVDSQLLQIEKKAIFEQMRADFGLCRRLLAGLSVKLHTLINDVESYSLRSGVQRVVGYLLSHAETVNNNSVNVTLPTSKHIIASRLNLTPESLSRIFHYLINHQLITVDGKCVTILDIERLSRIDI